MDRLLMGEVAKRGGVGLETIRYYERQGLLPKPPRSASGYRMFPPDSARRVRFIKRAQELGFTLKEIKELLALRIEPDTSCADVRQFADAKLADIDEKIRTLQSMKRVLKRVAATCPENGPITACPILESLETEGIKR